MILMAVVDNGGGMLFNHRRQSQDRILREKMLELAGNHLLFVSPYTAKLFAPDEQARLHVSENFLAEAGAGDYAWTEKQPAAPWQERIEKIFLFHWNRDYPADFWFDVDVKNGWQLKNAEEFPGSSHDKITMEEYAR